MRAVVRAPALQIGTLGQSHAVIARQENPNFGLFTNVVTEGIVASESTSGTDSWVPTPTLQAQDIPRPVTDPRRRRSSVLRYRRGSTDLV